MQCSPVEFCVLMSHLSDVSSQLAAASEMTFKDLQSDLLQQIIKKVVYCTCMLFTDVRLIFFVLEIFSDSTCGPKFYYSNINLEKKISVQIFRLLIFSRSNTN